MDHMRHLERGAYAIRDYIPRLKLISREQRALGVRWFFEVCLYSEHDPEVPHTAVHVMDAYLCKGARADMPVSAMYSVMTAALLIASKVESVSALRPQEVIRLAGAEERVSVQSLLTTEARMLEAIEYRTTPPTAAHFLRYFLRRCGCDCVHAARAFDLAELALCMKPGTSGSLVAAAAVLAAADGPDWIRRIEADLERMSGWQRVTIVQTAEVLVQVDERRRACVREQ